MSKKREVKSVGQVSKSWLKNLLSSLPIGVGGNKVITRRAQDEINKKLGE